MSLSHDTLVNTSVKEFDSSEQAYHTLLHMSEHVVRPYDPEGMGKSHSWPLGEMMTRRRFVREKLTASLGFGAAFLSGVTLERVAVPRILKEVNKYRSIGGDYSNWPFFNEIDAHPIDRERLEELFGELSPQAEVLLIPAAFETSKNPTKIAEYDLITPKDGPVYAEFNGLYGQEVSLSIVRAVVDDEEELFIPLVRDDAEQPSLSIQLGDLSQGAHRLELFVEHSTGDPVVAQEVVPRVTQDEAGSLHDLIYRHQPDIYLRNYGDITNNFPRRSIAEVLETSDGNLAVVYTIESFDEDQVLGIVGTSVQQLVDTKHRPSDYDWAVELLIGKENGKILKGNICEPFHNRQPIPINPNITSERLAIRASSPNNNWELVNANSPIRNYAKFRPVPEIATHDEMWGIRRSTDISTARWSLCENYEERKIYPNNPRDAAILEQFSLDVDRCKP